MKTPFDIAFLIRAQGLLPNEGLLVLLADLIKELARQGVKVRIFTATRHTLELAKVMTANNVRPDGYELVGFDVSPAVVKIWAWRLYRLDRRTSYVSRLFGLLIKLLYPIMHWLVEFVSRLSVMGLLFFFVIALIGVLLVGVPVAIAMLLVAILLPLVTKLWNANFLRATLAGTRAGRLLIRLYRRFNRDLIDAAFKAESQRLANKINRRRDIRMIFSPNAFNGTLLSKIRKPKLLVFPDFVVGQFPTRFLGFISKQDCAQIAQSIASADAIVCYSQSVADQQLRVRFAKEASGKPVHIIPQGFFSTRDNRESSDKKIVFKNFFIETFCSYLPNYDIREIDYVVYPSVDRPHKNMVTLVRAIEYLIRKRHRNIKVITTSHAITPDTYLFIEAKRVFLDCLFAPSLTEGQLNQLIRHARLVVHPSLSEGGDIFNFSRGVAAGVPVLMADIPMVREMFERYGTPQNVFEPWLFQPTNYLELANLIDRSLCERDQLVRAQAAVLKGLEHYDYAAMAKKYYEAYLALAPRLVA